MKTKQPDIEYTAEVDPQTGLARFTSVPARVDTPSNFKSVKRLTRDVANITRLGEAIVLCQSNLYYIDMDSQFTPGIKQKVGAVDCLDCLRGDEYTLVCGAVLHSTFTRIDGGLEGKYFAIRSGEMATGKRYRKVDVVMLERVE